MKIDEFVLNFEDVKKTGENSYQCKCNSHMDNNPSLCITQKGDKILLHCFAGCSYEKILKNAGLKKKDLFNNREEKEIMKKISKEYIYTDEEGNKLYKVIRYEPKSFTQAKYDNGKWVFKMTGVKYVPYNLPNILKSDIVYFVEGEKDADNLNSLGLCATTTVGGAQGFKKRALDYAKCLQNKEVYIIPDNDEAGKKYADLIYDTLDGIAASVKILNLINEIPDLKNKGDISDILQKYGKDTTLEILETLRTTDYPENNDAFPINNIDELNEKTFEEMLQYLNIKIRYNLITKRVEISGMPEKYSKSDLYAILPIYLKGVLRNKGIKINETKKVEEFITLEISKNNYNPIIEMLNSKEWDRKDRLEKIFEIFGIENKFYKTLFKKWLLQTVAMQFNSLEKPFGAEGILILQGKQGIGKSWGLSLLCPNPEWFADGVVIDMNNKDSQIKATSRWIVELRRNGLNIKKRAKCAKSFYYKP